MCEGLECDYEAAMFHEKYAADLGVLEAIETLANLYLNKDRNIFVNYKIEVREINSQHI